MKKLMIAAAVAAIAGGAFASACEPECPIVKDVARVYQVQFNIYTTSGHVLAQSGIGATQCAPGEDACIVMRGKDKTVFRGDVYVCENLCELSDYAAAFADVRRRALVDDAEFEWTFCNVMGKNSTDAECAWEFKGTVTYDEERAQAYALTGAGYGKYVHSTEGFFDNLGGYFAGTASASYDLKTKLTLANAECICKPSQVLKCTAVDGISFEDSDTVAFGAWKMKFNANVTKEYMKKGEFIFFDLLQKMFK